MITKEEILKLFEENKILKIDEEIINIIYLLNFKIGLKTRNSCSGHKKYSMYIQFREDINEDKVYDLINYLSDNFYFDDNKKGNCDFWMEKSCRRYDNELHINWTFRAANYGPDYNLIYILKFEKCLLDYINYKER